MAIEVSKQGTVIDRVDISGHGAFVSGRNTAGLTCGTMQLDHDSISRRHAAVVHDMQGKSYLVDLGSRYGTKLEGAPIKPRTYKALQDGISFQLGASTRTFTLRVGGGHDKTEALPAEQKAPASSSQQPASAPAKLAVAGDEDEDPMHNYTDDPGQFEADQLQGEAVDGDALAAQKREKSKHKHKDKDKDKAKQKHKHKHQHKEKHDKHKKRAREDTEPSSDLREGDKHAKRAESEDA